MVKKILVVDDYEPYRQLILDTLEFQGYELHEAVNGEEGWHKAQQIKPDLVLLDIMMPGALDGFQVCEKIKSDPTLKKKTHVVFLSSRNQQSDVEHGTWLGCDAYITKPFSPLQLLDTISDTLS